MQFLWKRLRDNSLNRVVPWARVVCVFKLIKPMARITQTDGRIPLMGISPSRQPRQKSNLVCIVISTIMPVWRKSNSCRREPIAEQSGVVALPLRPPLFSTRGRLIEFDASVVPIIRDNRCDYIKERIALS